MKYKIRNISGYLSIAGLFPGKSKIVNKLSTEMCKLKSEGLLEITKIIEEKPPVKITTSDTKKEEASK